MKYIFSILIFLVICQTNAIAQKLIRVAYPQAKGRTHSPGHIVYYIDPNKGNDLNSGVNAAKPWKSFHPLNQLLFSAGDKVKILSAGAFHESLMIMGCGTTEAPIEISFAAGRYDFFPDSAFKEKMQITNNNNRPDELKAIAVYILNAKHVDVLGENALLMMHGKMIEMCIDHAEDVAVRGLSFDFYRPTVSEMTVTNIGLGYADLIVHPDSKYIIADSLITWEGEGWHYQPDSHWQIFDPLSGMLKGLAFPIEKIRFTETSPGKLRAHFNQNPGYKVGLVFQNRDITRDCAGIFIPRSKNISLRNIQLYFMHGMGVVCQFCENIKIDSVFVKPRLGSGRTCSAWADILHFSGCKGKIEVSNSYLSASNDDAINVHGIHLQILEIPSANEVRVAFKHHETYGFNPYKAFDSIDFIHPSTLLPIGANVILKAEMLNDKEVLLTLKNPVPIQVKPGDAVENTTATPQVWIHDNVIDRIPARGILVSSRRKMLIQRNWITNTNSSAILVSDDAASWYESGLVRDLTILENCFVKCGEPVIDIHPENTEEGATAVHSGITVSRNSFDLSGTQLFDAKSTSGIKINNNTIKIPVLGKKMKDLIMLKNCNKVAIDSNNLVLKDKE